MRAFDYNTISDVIIQMNYTAKEGGDILKGKANDVLQNTLMSMVLGSENTGLTRMYSLKHEFSNEWYRFLNPPKNQDGQHALLKIGKEKFPFLFTNHTINIIGLEMIMTIGHEFTSDSHSLKLTVTMPSGKQLTSKIDELETEGITLQSADTLNGQLHQRSSITLTEEPGEWLVEVNEDQIPEVLKIEQNGHTRLSLLAVKKFNNHFVLQYYDPLRLPCNFVATDILINLILSELYYSSNLVGKGHALLKIDVQYLVFQSGFYMLILYFLSTHISCKCCLIAELLWYEKSQCKRKISCS